MSTPVYFLLVGLAFVAYGIKHGSAKVTYEDTNLKMGFGLFIGACLIGMSLVLFYVGPHKTSTNSPPGKHALPQAAFLFI